MKRSLFPALVAVIVGVYIYAVPPGTTEEIAERIKPFGSVCRVGDDCGSATEVASSGPLSGQAVYDQFCFACHLSGVGGAPLLGDAAQWEPRIAKGIDVLMASTINGLNAMPAKGTCMNCSDEELQAAVDYMLEQVN